MPSFQRTTSDTGAGRTKHSLQRLRGASTQAKEAVATSTYAWGERAPDPDTWLGARRRRGVHKVGWHHETLRGVTNQGLDRQSQLRSDLGETLIDNPRKDYGTLGPMSRRSAGEAIAGIRRTR